MKCFAAFFGFLLCAATGLAAATADSVRFDARSGLSALPVCGAVTDSNGLIWFSTCKGLDCFDGYEFHHLRTDPADSTGVATNHIYDILPAANGNILCHTDNDIHEFSLSDFRFHAAPQSRKDSVAPLLGETWHGFTDNNGIRWAGRRDGLYKYVASHHPALLLESTAGRDARAILWADSSLWVGTRRDCSLRRFDAQGTLLQTKQLEAPPYCLFRSSDGGVWVGCKPGGLFDPDGRRICTDAVYDIAADAAGNLWIATFGDGVKVLTDGVLSPSLGGRKVRKLLITSSGNIIAATTEGLLAGLIDSINPSATTLRPVRHISGQPRSLSSDATMSVAADGRGRIFVATESSGVDCISEESLFGPDPVFRHLDSRNGLLPSDICNALAMVSDSLLAVVGTDNLVLFNTFSDSYVNYSASFWADDIDFGEATPVAMPDGSIAIGAFNGAFIATGHHLHSRGYIPPLVFTTLGINGAPDRFCLPGKSSLRLAAPERNITIGFAAIDYSDNSHIRYRTRLDGSAWTASYTARKASLFALSPGSHIFEVQSTDRYGRWVENTASITLLVDSFWHETWWARAAAWLAVALFAGAVVWTVLYMRNIRRQRRDLLQKYLALLNSGADPPRKPEASPRNPADAAFLNRVKAYIEANIANCDANIDEMARACAVSRSTLNRRLRSLMGTSAAQLLAEARMQRAAALMAKPGADFTEVADACGFADVKYFRQVYRKKFG